MHFRKSTDGMRFWPLRERNQPFSAVILRRFYMHFDAILHYFGLPSKSLISVYEWFSKHVEMRNFHHFLKRFLIKENRVRRNVWWIFWKINTKLDRKEVIHFWAISKPRSGFLDFFTRPRKKHDIGDDLWVEIIKFWLPRPLKNDQKMTFPWV